MLATKGTNVLRVESPTGAFLEVIVKYDGNYLQSLISF